MSVTQRIALVASLFIGVVNAHAQTECFATDGTAYICTFPNGCEGRKYCIGGRYTACEPYGGNRIACEACGTGGTAVFDERCQPGPCQPPTARPETTCDACDDDRDYNLDTFAEGTQTLSAACGNQYCPGRKLCSGGAWKPCDWTRTPVDCVNDCGVQGVAQCSSLAQYLGCKAPAEQCVQGQGGLTCDDDLDGRIDNMPGTTTLLNEPYNPAQCEVAGVRYCVSGRWNAPTNCGGESMCNLPSGELGAQLCNLDCSVVPFCLSRHCTSSSTSTAGTRAATRRA